MVRKPVITPAVPHVPPCHHPPMDKAIEHGASEVERLRELLLLVYPYVRRTSYNRRIIVRLERAVSYLSVHSARPRSQSVSVVAGAIAAPHRSAS
jgi:hypothetical protein